MSSKYLLSPRQWLKSIPLPTISQWLWEALQLKLY